MEDWVITHRCRVCGNEADINCTTGEATSYDEDYVDPLRIPEFITLTTFREYSIKHGIPPKSNYKWHLLTITKMPNPEEELLGWKYFSQFEKDLAPLSTKLNLGSGRGEDGDGGSYFDEVRWENIKEDISVESVMLFDHTLDIPASWCPVNLTATVGGSITITQMEVRRG